MNECNQPPMYLELAVPPSERTVGGQTVGGAVTGDNGDTPSAEEVIRIAYHQYSPQLPDPNLSILFCGGFRSSMTGIKAKFLRTYCSSRDLTYCCFDYRGHGQSSRVTTSAPTETAFWKGHASIGNWIADALHVMDHVLSTASPSAPSLPRRQQRRVVVVGSSMGAWVALHLARARPRHVAGLVLLAAAPDFTVNLFHQFTKEQRDDLMEKGVVRVPSPYDPALPYPVTRHLVDEARRWLLLSEDGPSALGAEGSVSCPVRLLHGKVDSDISYHKSLELAKALSSHPTADVQVTLVEDGDHRLSRPSDLTLLEATLDSLIATIRERETSTKGG